MLFPTDSSLVSLSRLPGPLGHHHSPHVLLPASGHVFVHTPISSDAFQEPSHPFLKPIKCSAGDVSQSSSDSSRARAALQPKAPWCVQLCPVTAQNRSGGMVPAAPVGCSRITIFRPDLRSCVLSGCAHQLLAPLRCCFYPPRHCL